MNQKITVDTEIHAPIERVWKAWNDPKHVVKWNNASSDWHTTKAENDVKEGGRFNYRMEAKDGSAGFDFSGVYDEVVKDEWIAYTMDDGRKVEISFEWEPGENGKTWITETFEAESENPIEMQKDGWQAILDNFKKYVEAQK